MSFFIDRYSREHGNLEFRSEAEVIDFATRAVEDKETYNTTYLVLTRLAQALERAKGGREGKGGDAARACLRLVDLMRQFQGQGA